MFIRKQKEVIFMNEKEKSLIAKISEYLHKLSKEDQKYVLGIAEGMAFMKEDSSKVHQLQKIG